MRIFYSNGEVSKLLQEPLLECDMKTDIQISCVFLAPDVVPQGKTYSRFSIDVDAKRIIQNGKGALFINASDVTNTLRVKRELNGDGFKYLHGLLRDASDQSRI